MKEKTFCQKKYFFRPQVTGKKNGISAFLSHTSEKVFNNFFSYYNQSILYILLHNGKNPRKSHTQDQVYLSPGSWCPAVEQTSNLYRSLRFHPIKVIFFMILSFVYIFFFPIQIGWLLRVVIFDTAKTAIYRSSGNL